MKSHRLITFHGWLTLCFNCRRVRLRNPSSERYFRRPCPAWED
jgi:hypothetical protein